MINLRILGIDPGIATIGFGVLDYQNNKFSLVKCGVITTPPHISLSSRLDQIYNDLGDLIGAFKPDCASVEELFFNTNITTGISVAHGRGVILLACYKANLPIYEYTPLQIKSSLTGYGRADKKQVQTMVKMILGLAEVPKPDDTADALAAAICHAHHAGSRIPR